jgi:hypothetical protein
MADIKIINGEITSITQGIEFNNTNNTASGTYSAAFGNSSTASGNASFVMGGGNLASATNAFAGGESCTASSADSFSFGNINFAGGITSAILGGESNSISGVSITSYSAIIGGVSNKILAPNQPSTGSFISSSFVSSIINGAGCAIVGTIGSIISGGTGSSDEASSCAIIGGSSNAISGTSNTNFGNVILAGYNHKVKANTDGKGHNNSIIGGSGHTINNVNRSVIIGGNGITLTEDDTIYLGGVKRGGYVLSTTLTSALANTSNTSYSNIGSFNAVANGIYKIRFVGTYQTAATTTGIKVRMAGTATANVVGYLDGSISAAAVASSLRFPISTMTSELVTTGVSAINTPHAIEGEIIVRCTVAGTVILQMASEVNLSSAQLNIGTTMIVERIN